VSAAGRSRACPSDSMEVWVKTATMTGACRKVARPRRCAARLHDARTPGEETTGSTQPCVPPGSLNRVPALVVFISPRSGSASNKLAAVKAGMLDLPGDR